MSNIHSLNKKIGLFGGGQLARMLALQGHALGFEMHVLSESSEDPAAQVVRHHHLGKLNDARVLRSFLTQVDVATFESEFLNADLLQHLAAETGKRIFPEPRVMGLVQDRLTQKEALVDAKIPTLPYVAIDGAEDLGSLLDEAQFPLVIKRRRFGYDGYGTFHLRSSLDLPAVEEKMSGIVDGYIVEPRVFFKRELALSVVRNARGEKVALPLIETHQEDSRCDWVKGPVHHRDLKRIQKLLFQLTDKLSYVGILAAEIFETKQGLFVNELAPRVHNSAHYSLDALNADQFSLHLLAVAGESLPKLRTLSGGFAMANLLGKTGETPDWSHPLSGRMHWYGKSENRPGRKMGHINAWGKTADEALKLVLQSRKKFQL